MNDTIQEEQSRPFYNEWVDINQLPIAEDSEFVGLEPEYLYVRLSNILITTILGGLVLAIFVFLSAFTFSVKFMVLLGFVLLMAFWGLLTYLEFHQRGYAIRSQDVAYRSGYIFRQRQFLPFRRVQHCKITEGLIERLFNFSTVIISAAGDDIVVHGLRPEEAQKLQQFVNEKVDELTKEMHYG
ncbi:PH domain-containing protein [Membranicola marinus]|uniref:PH domain-containing protein n=1 Tax=Membranihabitans marinus TaxID=1227546 RepID=A0A953HLU2_9BACT|nr:PH domain-containing protein [Membranihabitans marinus]MBY5958027.1 PH domain-containing protein [Membranihabitans marinus]